MYNDIKTRGVLENIMRKLDKENFYRCIDEIKFIIESNKVLSRKDIEHIENEIITIKFKLRERYIHE